RTLKYRRAEAVSEIARRVLSGTETPEPELVPEPDGPAIAADVADADAPAKRPITSKRVTAAKPRPAVVSLSVLIDFQTLTGVLAANGICELFDGTPISPDTVRRLACDAAIIPMVLGRRGEVLDQGRRIYAPTTAQRHAVAIRDRHCAFPGCRRPAKWTDVHHIVAFKPGAANGGRTDLDNLLLLCDVHHRLVHEGHWRLDGTAFDFDVYRPDGTRFDHVTRGPP
ncbi:MAG TPA: HNH endonuclease signature motif containing protein, partial [Acidimicrobiales bacterium]|nr:HNH endonuclease signature motif containing protein [Acidimicrobiales bacterium]